ncbi:hypothetical protein P152DRAFT_89018 [Eremomyces bilateralis CBS 781.70]|uniref:tRNA (guanine(9)-N1)-methyltransferase n=1 Tax=Eremomyces bilateralis CBS 781.70 TaxID=1392243 RepID=A0A6G1FXD2_9PEZI|nr:uncharacterized protein P152DRAFT_89018 [Eremomyces bilateralis CBS 781.70]KAF1810555.1 hypothetical protein P152DRAFT_89018 [Eremomyces bilateralis CBS 781.70]
MAEEERPTKIRKLSPSSKSQAAHSHTESGPSVPSSSDNAILDTMTPTVDNPHHDSPEPSEHPSLASTPDGTTQNMPDPSQDPGADPSKPMSKNQLKKLRRKEHWESQRDARKVKRKLERIRRSERKRAEKASAPALLPSTDAPESADAAPQPGSRPPPRRKPTVVPITILFDCAFEPLMTENELKSLGSQITRCYSDNRQAKYRVCLGVASWGGKLQERFEGVLESQYKMWKGMQFREEPVEEVVGMAREWMKGGKYEGALKKWEMGEGGEEGDKLEEGRTAEKGEGRGTLPEGEVIYLSSESDETLTELKPNSTYIIGGLVDRNRHKGLCYKTAVEKGIKTARLPIGDYLQMSSRKVLTTNHVNQIMLRWLETGDWAEAFLKVIPQRKRAALRKGEEAEVEEEVEEEAEDGGNGEEDRVEMDMEIGDEAVNDDHETKEQVA